MQRIRYCPFVATIVAALVLAPLSASAVVLYEEGFESVALNPVVTFPSEIADRQAWSSLSAAQAKGALSGWQDEKLGVLGTLDPVNSGVREFLGWTFVDKDWWIQTSGDQDRSNFARGYGIVGVADNDEFDDFSFGPAENQGLTNDRCDSVGTASPGSGGCYAATLTTPPISIAGQPAGSVRVVFDSSWRPEGEGPFAEVPDDPATTADEFQPASSGTFQTGRFEVSFDNGPFTPIFTYRSDNTQGQRTLVTTPTDPAGVFKDDLELANEVVDVAVNNPVGASTMRVRFNTYDAGNDWWWGVDNIQAYTGAPGPRDPALKVVVNRDSGGVTIVNGTSKAISLRGFEIHSEDGAFNEAAATFQADTNSNWIQLTQAGSGTDLSEGHATSAALASGATINLGPAWAPYFADSGDISFQYLVDGKTEPIFGLVEVTGGIGGKAYPFLDLNFDGAVTIADWTTFLAVTDRADLSDLSVAQAYRKGDLDGNRKLGVTDFVTFQREYDRINGVGAFQAASANLVPEPSSAVLLTAIGCALVARSRRRFFLRKTSTSDTRRAFAGLVASLAASGILLHGNANAAVTVDRFYRLGDDPRESAAAGEEVALNTPQAPFAKGESIDSQGAVGAGQLVVNIKPNAGFGPHYVQVTDRPDFTTGQTGLAVQFDASNFENLLGTRFGTPETSISSTFAGGAVDYTYILDRGLQFWTKPLAVPNSNSDDPADDVHIVMDTTNHGALIDSHGRFTMRYGLENYPGVGDDALANVGQWSHIMIVRPDGPVNGARMYVDGIAVAAATGDYPRGIPSTGTADDAPDTAPLVIGGATFPRSNQFSQGFENNYTGIVDDLEIFATGFNGSTDGVGGTGDFGIFDLRQDNDYILRFGPTNPLDLAGDNGVINRADVDVFVSNWQYAKEINGLLVGDLETARRGDFNYDGIVNLRDWEVLNAAQPALAAVAMNLINAVAVPEPTCLALIFCVATSSAGWWRGMRRSRRIEA